MLAELSQKFWWLSGGTAALTLLAIIVTALLVVRMPADFFTAVPKKPDHPIWMVLKNVLGVSIVIIGIVLSLPLVPGPGLPLIALGISLTTFPGKRKLELLLLRRKWIMGPLNLLRGRFGRPPLEVPAHVHH